jgi:chloramphenicol-sensitive protein RarD
MHQKGILYALCAYVMWGLFPLYWKQLEDIPTLQLIGHRIVWSFLLLLAVLLISGRLASLIAALNTRTLRTYGAAALLIASNWYVYVWAVTHAYVVEASLGYYINPLFSVLLGVIVFRERLRGWQWLPIALAAFGVLFLALNFGGLPWIALVLAATFGLYGLMKKIAPLGPLFGLSMETGILFLPAAAYLTLSEASGTGAFLHVSPTQSLMMIGGGVITAVPLLFFAAAAARVPLSTMGVLQYVTPTMQFLLGVLAYHEPFTGARWIGFVIVWVALVLFWAEGLYARRSGGGLPLAELGEG